MAKGRKKNSIVDVQLGSYETGVQFCSLIIE